MLFGSSVDAVASRDDDEAEHTLADDVKDSVEDALSVGRNHASTFSKAPDDRVGGPEEDGDLGSLVVDLAGGRSELGGVDAESEEVDDGHERQHAEAPESPACYILGTDQTTDEARDDHEEVGGKKPEGYVPGSTGKASKVKKHEWCGERPIDVASEEELPVDVVGSRAGDVNVTVASCHYEVGNRGDSVNKEGEDVEVSLAVGLLEGRECHVQARDEETTKGHPQADLTYMVDGFRTITGVLRNAMFGVGGSGFGTGGGKGQVEHGGAESSGHSEQKVD